MDINNNFYKEATEWMQSINYSEHFRNADKSSITFISNSLGECYPSITCFINELNEKRCKLNDAVNFKMFLNLTSTDIDFKHSKILKYIEVFRHYANLAKQFPPF